MHKIAWKLLLKMKSKSRKNNFSSKKAQVWVSAIIYTLVAILALVLILNTGIPILTELKDRAVFEKVKDVMLDLDKQITEIAGQGEGSQATVSFEVKEGEVKFQDNQLIWEIETDSEIISPRSRTKIGNLIIASNANVKTIETDSHFIMESYIQNDTFRVAFNKTGSESSWVMYNVSDIIQNISYNGNNMDGDFTFSLNNNASTVENITGYVKMTPPGNNSNLGSARITAHINSSFAEYDLVFTLGSYADFITLNVKNIEIK